MRIRETYHTYKDKRECVIKIRCLSTSLSHFAQAGQSAHTKASDEYVIKKR